VSVVVNPCLRIETWGTHFFRLVQNETQVLRLRPFGAALRMTGFLLAGFDQAYEGCEEGCVWDGDVVLCCGSDYRSVDGVDLGAAVGVDVLEHGGLMAGVGFEGLEDHRLGAVEVGGDAAGVGDGDDFGDDGEGGGGAGGD